MSTDTIKLIFDRSIVKRCKRCLIEYLSFFSYRNLARTTPSLSSLSLSKSLFTTSIYIFSSPVKTRVAFFTLHTSLISYYNLALTIFSTLFWALIHAFLYYFYNYAIIIFLSLSKPELPNCLYLLHRLLILVEPHIRLVKSLKATNIARTARLLILSNANSSPDGKMEQTLANNLFSTLQSVGNKLDTNLLLRNKLINISSLVKALQIRLTKKLFTKPSVIWSCLVLQK